MGKYNVSGYTILEDGRRIEVNMNIVAEDREDAKEVAKYRISDEYGTIEGSNLDAIELTEKRNSNKVDAKVDRKDLSGNYYSTNDFVGTHKLQEQAENIFGKGWEAEDDVAQIESLIKSLGGGYVVSIPEDRSQWNGMRQMYDLANPTNDSNYDIFVISESDFQFAKGGGINSGRDSIFKSKQKWEQDYDRKREWKEYKKEGWFANWFKDGGEVNKKYKVDVKSYNYANTLIHTKYFDTEESAKKFASQIDSWNDDGYAFNIYGYDKTSKKIKIDYFEYDDERIEEIKKNPKYKLCDNWELEMEVLSSKKTVIFSKNFDSFNKAKLYFQKLEGEDLFALINGEHWEENEEYKKGGNVGRDLIFKSKQKWEQNYDRKREYKEYKKEGWLANWFKDGGEVEIVQDKAYGKGYYVIRKYDTNNILHDSIEGLSQAYRVADDNGYEVIYAEGYDNDEFKDGGGIGERVGKVDWNNFSMQDVLNEYKNLQIWQGEYKGNLETKFTLENFQIGVFGMGELVEITLHARPLNNYDRFNVMFVANTDFVKIKPNQQGDALLDIKRMASDIVEQFPNYGGYDKEILADGGRVVSNSSARSMVANKSPFRASNLSGRNFGNVYVVESYGYYPLFVYKNGVWYENANKFSASTSKQMSQSRPNAETILSSTKELEGMYKFADGGLAWRGNENAEMVINNNNQIKHHTEELEKIVTPETEVPAWVVSKVNRSASDLSDATHYLDGVSKYEDGGMETSKISTATLEAMVGRKLDGWNDDVVYFNGAKYQKCYLQPFYKLK